MATVEEERNVTKEEVLQLMERKGPLEAELSAHFSILESQRVGMEESLVDAEGYPRNDIDVYKIRTARNRIICLRNDLKALMGEIERGLHNLHAQSRDGIGMVAGGAGGSSLPSTSSSPMDTSATTRDQQEEEPLPVTFARIDLVSEGSPAERAGLLVGDEIAEFGSIRAENFSGMQSLAELVQHSQGQEIRLNVVRGEGRRREKRSLDLVPRTWSGRGLLGCNIVPIEQGGGAGAIDR